MLGGGCAGSDEASTEPASSSEGARAQQVRVETLVLQPTTFEDVVEVTGTVRSLNDAELTAEASGTIEYLAPLGKQVARGEVVARLDQDLARAALEQARANMKSAQARFDLAEDAYQRQEPLYRDSIISALEWENVVAQYNEAQAQLAQAEASVSQAQKQLEQTEIRAPFRGTVEEQFADEGEQVAPSTPVVRILATQRVRLRAGIPERYAGDIRPGIRTTVRLQAYGMDSLSAPVTFVGQAINPQSRTFPVEVELHNPDGVLKPDMVAQIAIPREQFDDALVVPRTAVIRSESGDAVFVVERSDTTATAARRYVTLGPAYGGNIVVEDGLRAGDEVVVLGQTDLTEGVAVNVVEQYTSSDEAADSVEDERPLTRNEVE